MDLYINLLLVKTLNSVLRTARKTSATSVSMYHTIIFFATVTRHSYQLYLCDKTFIRLQICTEDFSKGILIGSGNFQKFSFCLYICKCAMGGTGHTHTNTSYSMLIETHVDYALRLQLTNTL